MNELCPICGASIGAIKEMLFDDPTDDNYQQAVVMLGCEGCHEAVYGYKVEVTG